MRTLLLAVSFLLFGAALGAAPPDLRSYFADGSKLKEGGVKRITVKTPKGEFQVWTKRFGSHPRIKLLLLHGGPGGTHEAFECFEGFLPAEGIEFIYYDQLGSAYSDQPKDPDLWTTARFVEEVEQVRLALGLGRDNFYLLGHSWGGILAVEYALKYGSNLKGLVISNMMMSIPDYNAYAERVLAPQMDPAVVKEIKELEAKRLYDSPRYQDLLLPNFYAKHLCRLAEWPDALNRMFTHLNKDIYVLMQGPSEFGASGRLERWERKADLAKLAMPTLVIGGRHDTMDPAHMRWIATQVQHGSFLLCPEGSHCSFWDDQAHYFPGLVGWLKAVDQGRRTVDLARP